jgi:hypothetical protein
MLNLVGSVRVVYFGRQPFFNTVLKVKLTINFHNSQICRIFVLLKTNTYVSIYHFYLHNRIRFSLLLSEQETK